MKILLISTQDYLGGAARATYRLHQGLQNSGISSHILVQEKSSSDKTVISPQLRLNQGIARSKLTFDALPLKFYRQKEKTTFSLQWVPDKIKKKVAIFDPDIINLHWINGAFIQTETIGKLNKPIVWTLHDMWAFTGGCHYSGECNLYTESCGKCPQLKSSRDWDLSRWVWQRKAKAWKNTSLTIVSPSNWLAKTAVSSSLFKNLHIEVIPNGIDSKIYKPIASNIARQILNLPQDKKLIVFGSLQATSDYRKGFHLLQNALQELSKTFWKEELEIVIFGASQPDNPVNFGFKAHYLGTFNDDLSLSIVYSAADIFVSPSIQENLANTVMEAIACGTPVVAFDIGGMSDLIEHQKNGYLAQPYKIEDFAYGIAWVLENKDRYKKLSDYARHKVEQEFTLEIQAKRYSSLYEQTLSQSN
jgi:glycosyltransferase involved in cell wall biosynthesis